MNEVIKDNSEAKSKGTANLIPFTKDRRPNALKIKEGWERRRQGQAMMNKIKQYMELPADQFHAMLKDIKENPHKYTVHDVLMSQYALKALKGDRFLLDWVDRNISKAPVEVTGKDGGEIALKIIPILGGITKQEGENVDNLPPNDTIMDGEVIEDVK